MDQQMLDATMRLVHATWGVVLATFLLVIATAGMLWDSWRKGNEERGRRKREDAIRAEENKPKAVFWLKRRSEDQIGLWCVNLGTVNFIVAKMTIKPLQGEHTLDIAIDKPVVLVGTEWQVDLGSTKFGCLNGNYGVSLSLQGPSGEVISEEQAYRLYVSNRTCMTLSQGFDWLTPEPIDCPKNLLKFA